MHLVWDIREMIGWLEWEWKEEEWLRKEGLWEQLTEQFIQYLKGRSTMQGIIVIVGHHILKLERKGVQWEVVPY